MFKTFLAALAGAFCAIGIQAMADRLPSGYAEAEVGGEEKAARYRLCRFWSRDFQSNSYVCDSLDFYTQIIEERDLRPYENAIRSNEGRIALLESRVTALESE